MPWNERRLALGLGLAQCVSWGVLFYAFGVFLHPMSQSLPLSQSAISFMATLGALVAALASWPLGRWLDRGWHLPLMTGGSLLAAIGVGLWSLAESSILLYTAGIFLGLGQATTLYEPAFAFLVRHLGDEGPRHRAMTWVTLLGGMASPIFLPLSSLLTEMCGWRWALRILMVLLFIPAGIHWYWYRRLHSSTVERSENAQAPAVPLNREQLYLLRILLFVFLINSFAHTTFSVHLPSALQSWGFTAVGASWAVGFLGLMQLAGRTGLTSYVQWCGSRSLLLGPLLLMAIILFGIGAFQGHSINWLFLGLLGVVSGLLTLLRPIVVSRLFETKVFGRVNGFLGMAYQLARAAAPVSGSLLYERTHQYQWVFWTLTGLLLLAAGGAMRLGARVKV